MQVADALCYLHTQHSMLHGDLKSRWAHRPAQGAYAAAAWFRQAVVLQLPGLSRAASGSR